MLTIAPAGMALEASSAPTPSAQTIAAATAINDFGFVLLHQLSAYDRNVIISPFSVAQVMTLAYNGADGSTRSAMRRALRLPALSDDEINAANLLMQRIIGSADPSVQMEIANALWAQRDFPIQPEFVTLADRFYEAKAAPLDFKHDPVGSTATINQWVNDRTHGKIPKLFDRLDSTVRLVITDAVYFKGKWTDPFDPKQTTTRPFYGAHGESFPVPMMSMRDHSFPYFENDTFQAIRLPYGNRHFAMYVFLPRKNASYKAFLDSLNAADWGVWTRRLPFRKGRIDIPRLELRYGSSLNNALKSLGMAEAFSPDADFSRIHRGLIVSDVEHKTFVKVDEEGTTAAAATGASIVALAVHGPPPFEMIVDHPFVFAIADDATNALLFFGAIVDPRSNSD